MNFLNIQTKAIALNSFLSIFYYPFENLNHTISLLALQLDSTLSCSNIFRICSSPTPTRPCSSSSSNNLQGSMEQNLISHHSIGGNCRPKWLDKKRVLQVILLVTICMWLLHRVDNSHHQHENYNENPQNPSSERNILIVLGRRGIQKYINGANAEFQDKNDPHEYERRDGGVGDDEIDGNINDEENVLELLQEENKVVNGGDEAIDVAAKSHGVAKQDTEMEKLDDVERVEAFLDENGIPPDASSFFNSTSLEQFHSRTSFSV